MTQTTAEDMQTDQAIAEPSSLQESETANSEVRLTQLSD